MIPVSVLSLDCSRDDGVFGLKLDRWRGVARAVDRGGERRALPGSRDRKPRQVRGRGVWYWASPIEARLSHEQEIVLVGGGNSAGQAAVFLGVTPAGFYHGDPGGGLWRQHVALPDRAHRGHAEYRTGVNTEVVGLEGRKMVPRALCVCAALSAEQSTMDIRNLSCSSRRSATGWLRGLRRDVDRRRFV